MDVPVVGPVTPRVRPWPLALAVAIAVSGTFTPEPARALTARRFR
jgi:hypothetical protein